MTEREVNFNTSSIFSFICPEGREAEVLEIFSESDFGKLKSFAPNSERIIFDPETAKPIEVKGTRFDGITTIGCITNIMVVLSGKKIAAYSRETKLLFKPILEN